LNWIPAASKNSPCFKSGLKWLKNNHLALFTKITTKSLIHTVVLIIFMHPRFFPPKKNMFTCIHVIFRRYEWKNNSLLLIQICLILSIILIWMIFTLLYVLNPNFNNSPSSLNLNFHFFQSGQVIWWFVF